MPKLSFLRGKGLRRRIITLVHPRYWYINPKYWKKYEKPRVVYIIGMPRTGTTLMKRFFGDFDGFVLHMGGKVGDLIKNVKGSKIILVKNTRDIAKIKKIYQDHGNQTAFAGIIRDPRDELVSLLETDRHNEIPKNEEFWSFWMIQYKRFFDNAEVYSQRGARFCLVRYEDLVVKPASLKRDFLRWVDIDVPFNFLSDEYSNIVPEIASGENGREDWKAHLSRRVHSNSLNRWKKANDPEVNKLVHHYRRLPGVEEFMRQLGYCEELEDFRMDIPGVYILGSNLLK